MVGGYLLLYNKGLKDGYFTIKFYNKGQKSVKHVTSRAYLSFQTPFSSTLYVNNDLPPSIYVRAGLVLHKQVSTHKYLFIYKRILNIKKWCNGFAFGGLAYTILMTCV
jgi:hypothetical protein